MATSSILDESDLALIRKCQNGTTLQTWAFVRRILFWLSVVVGILAGFLLLGLYLIKGSQAVSESDLGTLCSIWFLEWIFWRHERARDKLVPLVCKLANDASILEESDRALIRKCRKGNGPAWVSVLFALPFWLIFVVAILGSSLILGMFVITGNTAVFGCAVGLLLIWFLVLSFWASDRQQGAEQQLARLVCKMADARAAAQSVT